MSTFSTFDLLAVQPAGDPAQPASLTLSPGRAVTGAQKAAQRWVIAFLTRLGSVAGDPAYGTDFVDSVVGNLIRGEADIRLAFKLAAQQVAAYEALYGPANRPADEIVTQAELTSFDVINRVLQIWVTLTTAAGTQRVITTPVATLSQ